MFEVFGPFIRPTIGVFPIVLALWPIVALALWRRAAIVCALGGVGALAALVVLSTWPADSRLIVQHLGLAARVGQLDLVLALGLDPLGALASAVVSLVTVMLLSKRSHARRTALLCATSCAAQFAVMADGAALLVLASGAASLGAAALGYMQNARFVADRVADLALAFAAALAFWMLGGSWVGQDYIPDLEPRVVVASREPSAPVVVDDDDDDKPRAAPTHRGARASLSLAALPNAVVLVDGTWLRTGPNGRVASSPFSDAPIAAGPHTIRVRVGPGSDDFYIPRMSAKDGADVQLAVRGATTTFREIQDDLVGGGREAIARRKFFGVPAASLVLALLAFAFVARTRIFPFAGSVDEPPRALLACVALVAMARFPFGDIATIAPWIACAFAAASIASSARALVKDDAPTLLAAELAIAGAACVSGAPVFGVLHGFVATLMFARGRAPTSGAAHVVLLPTRVGVIATCAPIPCAAILVASLLASCALARHHARTSRRAFVATIIAAATAIAALFALPKLIAPNAQGFHVPSIALVGLTCAMSAFAWGASRSKTLDRLASASFVRATSSASYFPSRVVGATGAAIAAALHELDARLGWLVAILDRALRGVSALLSFVDGSIVSKTHRALPFPSERIARFALAALALGAFALFAVPWLA